MAAPGRAPRSAGNGWFGLQSQLQVGVQDSPIALLVRNDRTNRLLAGLAQQLDALQLASTKGDELPVLEMSVREVAYARAQWQAAVLAGEHRLYDLATLLTWKLARTRRIQLVARVLVGPSEEAEKDGARIVIEETITRQRLKRTTDHTLAARIARRYKYRTAVNEPFGKLYARASYLELRPLETSEDIAATRVLTRVKANDQIWNKVCDALFDVDAVVQRDKMLNAGSKYIKDVFGIKILTARREDSYRVDALMSQMAFEPELVAELALSAGERIEHLPPLELVERKDYLSLPPEQKKRTGWEAIKNVYRWGGQLFEVQIQTEANYYAEAWDLSNTSHRTFEMQRRNMRRQLEERVPHYREFRRILKAIFGRTASGKSEIATDSGLPSWLKLVP